VVLSKLVDLDGSPPAIAFEKAEEGHPMADTYEGYCVKCRKKQNFEGTVKTLDNGKKAAQGLCPACGTKMTRILPKDA
jgi:hypothetical protein